MTREARDTDPPAVDASRQTRVERAAHSAADRRVRRYRRPTHSAPDGRSKGATVNLREAIVTYRRTPQTTCVRVTSSRDVAPLLRSLVPDAPQERFVVIALDNKNRAVTWTTIGVGSESTCQVDSVAVFRFMVTSGCSTFIVSHNHPSGEVTPSSEDVCLTAALRDGARLLGVRILDHIILGADSDYFSFLDAGLMVR